MKTPFVYLDHASGTIPYSSLENEWQTHYKDSSWANPSALHTYGRKSRSIIDRCRYELSQYTDASPEHIFFTSGGTEGLYTVIIGGFLWHKTNFPHRKTIFVSPTAHQSVLNAVDFACRYHGAKKQYMPIREDGSVHIHTIPEKTDTQFWDSIALVILEEANSEIGFLQPIDFFCKQMESGESGGASLIIDSACSAVTNSIPYKRGVTSVVCSSEKIGGGNGCGIVWQDPQKIIPPMGGSQEWGMRGGTQNSRSIFLTTQAFLHTQSVKDERKEHYKKLYQKLHSYLDSRSISILTPQDNIGHILTFMAPGKWKGEDMVIFFDKNGICISSGPACSSGSTKPSHALLHMGKNETDARKGVRISWGYTTTEADIDYFIDCFEKNIKSFGR